MNDAEWEALKQFADKLERIVAGLAKERKRRQMPAPARQLHSPPAPAQVEAGFLLEATEQTEPLHNEQ